MASVKEIKREYLDLLHNSIVGADVVTNDINEGIKLLLRYDNGRRDKIIRELRSNNSTLYREVLGLRKKVLSNELWLRQYKKPASRASSFWEAIKSKFGFM